MFGNKNSMVIDMKEKSLGLDEKRIEERGIV